jgi:GNAT superfamily N-acetyltransferase
MRLEDLPRVCELNVELGYVGSIDEMRARFDAIARRPEQGTFVAEVDGGAAGWLHAQAQHTLETGSYVEIVGLVVAAEARRHGIGRSLVHRAQGWTRELGYERLLVRTNVLREGAHEFYDALGFRRKKTQHVRELDATRPPFERRR